MTLFIPLYSSCSFFFHLKYAKSTYTKLLLLYGYIFVELVNTFIFLVAVILLFVFMFITYILISSSNYGKYEQTNIPVHRFLHWTSGGSILSYWNSGNFKVKKMNNNNWGCVPILLLCEQGRLWGSIFCGIELCQDLTNN